MPKTPQQKYKIICSRNVREVELQDDRTTVLIPFRPIGDVDFLATILYDALILGVEWKEIKELVKTPKRWGIKTVINHVRYNGRKIYAPSDSYLGARGFEYIRVE
jgi:hypothetical protein